MINVGYGCCDITPSTYEPLVGFIHRDSPSAGVLDPISVRVTVLQDDQRLLAWVSFETLIVTREFTKEMREVLKQRFGIEDVMISATHTHYAPTLKAYAWFESASFDYQKIIETQLIKAIEDAMNCLVPAKMGFSKCYFDEVGHSRLTRHTDHHHTFVSILSFVDLQHRPIVNLISYNCHPTVLGQSFNLVSGDYISQLLSLLDGGNQPSLFLQGPAGDISTRYTRTSKDAIKQKKHFGEKLYRQVMKQLKEIVYEPFISLQMVTEDIACRFKEIDLMALEQALIEVEQQFELRPDNRFLETKKQGYLVLKEMIKQKDQLEQDIELSVFKLNDAVIAFVAGEPYAGLDFLEKGFVVAYSNGYPGYIYDAYLIESYESISSMLDESMFDLIKRRLKQIVDQLN